MQEPIYLWLFTVEKFPKSWGLFDRLAEKRDDIEQELGQKLSWKRNVNSKRQSIILAWEFEDRVRANRKATGNTTPPREMWDDVVEFFSENAPKFERVMRKYLSEVS